MNRTITLISIIFISMSALSQTNVSISFTKSSMAENENIDIVATLETINDKDVIIDFEFSGTAQNDLDYTNSFLTKGKYTIVAGGNGSGNASNQIAEARGVFVDLNGNVYVADRKNHRVTKWMAGAIEGTVVAGGNGYGSAANQLNSPYNVFVDLNGNVYVADRGNSRIQKWLPGATEGVTVAGGNGVGSALNQLDSPQDMFVDLDGNIYVVDTGNDRIQKWVREATEGTTVAGGNGYGSAANQFNTPHGVSVDINGNIFVADFANYRIQKWAAGATEGITVVGENGAGAAPNQIRQPTDVFVDKDGSIYVCDINNHRIQKWPVGATEGITVADGIYVNRPHSIFIDAGGSVYFAELDWYRVRKMQHAPQIKIPAGELEGKITISGIEDEISNEVDETIIVNVKSALNASVVGDQQIILTILGVGGGTVGNPIVSTSYGGWWHKPSTWIGGILPNEEDDVIIDGTVRVKNTWPANIDCECMNLTINSEDSLYGDELGNYAALVTCNGNLVNNGTISQNGSYFDFDLTIKGDITNNGEIKNNHIYLDSENSQTFSSTHIIEVLNLEMKNGQNLLAGSDLSFVDTYFQFNNGGFIIDEGTSVSFSQQTAYAFTHIDKAHIKGGGTIFSENDFFFNDSTTIENMKLTGLIQGKGDFAILGNVELVDTLQQAEHNYPVEISIKEDFTNNGVIRDNPNDNDHLILNVQKNITNNGDWNNSWVLMEGATDQVFENKGNLNSSFSLKANVNSATTFQWFKNATSIDGATEEYYEINKYIDPENYNRVYGEYYCQTNAGDSRKITIVSSNSSGEEGVILSENFDGAVFPPLGWTQTSVSSNTWVQSNPEENNFTKIDNTSVYSALCPWIASDQNEWLFSPVFALSQGKYTLNFHAGFSTDFLTSATLKLSISIDGGTSWTKIWEAENDGEAWSWREISIDLSSYSNLSNIMLGWQYVGNDGDLAGIDNVEIKSTVTGITSQQKESTSILFQNYPNPFSSKTTISFELEKQKHTKLIIYNNVGQMIAKPFNGSLGSGKHRFDFDATGLNPGIYYYRLITDGFSTSKSMILIK